MNVSFNRQTVLDAYSKNTIYEKTFFVFVKSIKFIVIQ